MPRLDRTAQGSAWFGAVERAGIVVTVQPLDRNELPGWIAARLARSRQRASRETLQFLADTTEGNLLAAQQEIDKLALLLPEGELDPAAVEQAITDVARFDVFQLSEAWLGGDAARVCRILGALESAGEGAPLIVWQLGEDLHAMAAVFTATASGTHISAALRNARVWGKRQGAMERALRRVKPARAAGDAHRTGQARRAGQGHRPRQRLGSAARAGADAGRAPAHGRCVDGASADREPWRTPKHRGEKRRTHSTAAGSWRRS